MNGGQQRKPASGGEDLSPVLGLGVLGFGGVAFWWWQLGERARTEWLSGIGRASGYGPLPADMVEQIEWLVTHRMNDLHGMLPLFVLAAAGGVLEGNASRQRQALSGFGHLRLGAGRALLLLWLGLVVASIAAPVALPYGVVGGVLALGIFAAMYTIGGGLQRIH